MTSVSQTADGLTDVPTSNDVKFTTGITTQLFYF